MIKLFACDLDGTLLNEKHETDDIILNSIEVIKKNDCYFSIATGRDLNSSLNRNNFHKIYDICLNGALITDPDLNVIFKKEIDKTFLKAFLEEFPQLHVDCISINKTFVRQNKNEYIEAYKKQSIWNLVEFNESKMLDFMKFHHFNTSIEDILKEEILKLNFKAEDPSLSHSIHTFLQKYDYCIVNAPFTEGAFEITDKSVNKGNAVLALADILHIEPDEVAVYGDGGNDLEMLAMFQHSYATENASAEAKNAASQTIGHCKDHAVPEHILQTLKK